MKTVILDQKSPVITISDTCPGRYYGVSYGGEKGFITRERYQSGNFFTPCINILTNGNQWADVRGKTLNDTLIKAIESRFEVYEFDTAIELFTWLAGRY